MLLTVSEASAMAPGMQFPSRSPLMLYALYQTATDLMLPMRAWATVAGQALMAGGGASAESWRAASALCEMMSRATLSHRRPSFGIDEIKSGNRIVPVREEEVLATPFGTLLRFAKEGAPAAAARAAGGAALRPFRHPAARHGARAAARARRAHHRLGQCARCRHLAWPLRLRRICRAPDQVPRGDGAGRASWPSASPACRRWRPRR